MSKDVIETVITGKLKSMSNLVNETGCSTCLNNYPLKFKDIRSYKEFKIAGMCQDCQDEVFGSKPE